MFQERVDGAVLRNRLVGLGVCPLLVLANLQQKLNFGVLGEQRAEFRCRGLMVLGDDGGLAARYRRQYVDRGIVVLLRELARKDDVPVENGARLVGYRLGHVIAFDKNGVKRRYGTL